MDREFGNAQKASSEHRLLLTTDCYLAITSSPVCPPFPPIAAPSTGGALLDRLMYST